MDDLSFAQSRGDRPGARTTFLRLEDVSPGMRVCGAPPTPLGAVWRVVLGGGMSDEEEDGWSREDGRSREDDEEEDDV